MFSNSGPPDRNENRIGRSLSSKTQHTTSPATKHLMMPKYYDANRAIEPDLLARTERSAQQTPARWREGYQPWRRLWRLMVYSRVTTSSFLAPPGRCFFSAIAALPPCSLRRRRRRRRRRRNPRFSPARSGWIAPLYQH